MNSTLVRACLGRISPARLMICRLVSSQESQGDQQNLRDEVISLYKNLIYLSRDWHTDLRPQIKRAFVKNQDVKDPDEIRKLLDKGDYICRELIATYNLKKYRAMKRRYYSEDKDKHLQELFDSFSSQSVSKV